MNPSSDNIFAGFSGVLPSFDEYDLGGGAVFKKTYAHLMAPLMMAFSPAEKGKPHPAPWAAVSGGFSFDIHLQLHIPIEFKLENWFDRLNTVWWIASLLRFRLGHQLQVPAITNQPFSAISNNLKGASILPIEAIPHSLHFQTKSTKTISLEDMEWLKKVWLQTGRLVHENPEFNDAFQAFDEIGILRTKSMQLLTLWSVLEQLFCPAKQELRFRVSANISAFLEKPGKKRLELHHKILKLYDARSKAAHGTGVDVSNALKETYSLMKRILLKIIEDRSIPTRTDLDKMLFCT